MDPDRYCLDAAAPPGSSLYYATLFAGPDERAALVAVHALRHTLLEVVEDIADPNVRAHKLNWWSDEIMEAREGRARHPVALALTRHGGEAFWRRPELLAMLSAVAGLSAAGGLASATARDRFCEAVGGGTARLCATVAPFEPDEPGEAELSRFRILGTALEAATLAGVPNVRSGLERIPAPAPDARSGEAASAGPDNGARRIVEERVRAREALAGIAGNSPRRACPAMLAYRTLAGIQLAALANAIRKPAAAVPAAASITPIRKLWIAWRTARQGGAR